MIAKIDHFLWLIGPHPHSSILCRFGQLNSTLKVDGDHALRKVFENIYITGYIFMNQIDLVTFADR